MKSVFNYFRSSLIKTLLIVTPFLFLAPAFALADTGAHIDVWWPTQNVTIGGSQPFKALLSGADVSTYSMTWSVDGGQQNKMASNFQDYAHKEATVDLSSWNWQGSGPYTITFTTTDSKGTVTGTKSIQVSVLQKNTTSTPSPTPLPLVTKTVAPLPPLQQPSTPILSTITPVINTVTTPTLKLYVDTSSDAAKQAQSWLSSRPADAAVMTKLASQSTAAWFGGWNTNVQSDVNTLVTKSAAANSIAVLTLYNIPYRDCGSYSAGGTTAANYRSWVTSVANGIGERSALVVLEPDALANIDCLSSAQKTERLSLLSDAVSILKSHSHTKVYLDAGNAHWVDATTMATRLKQANIAKGDGFSLNVSNFYTTAESTTYGTSLSALVNGAHFIIDTSRNGNGSAGGSLWCNPTGRATGALPTLTTGQNLVDAYLWIKVPGQSDGACNGGPSAGTWWPDYALSLVRASSLF